MEARAWRLICSEVLTCGINNCPKINTQNILKKKTPQLSVRIKGEWSKGRAIWNCKPGAVDAGVGGAEAWPRRTAQPSCESSGNGRPADGTGSRRCEPRSWPIANHSHRQKEGRLGSEDQVSAAAKWEGNQRLAQSGNELIVHVVSC